jgi:hypothetical protein
MDVSSPNLAVLQGAAIFLWPPQCQPERASGTAPIKPAMAGKKKPLADNCGGLVCETPSDKRAMGQARLSVPKGRPWATPQPA